MNDGHLKKDLVEQLRENMIVAHFAVSSAGLFPLRSGPLPEVKLYMPDHFSLLGFRRIISPEQPSFAAIAYVGLGDPTATPMSFAFGFFLAMATYATAKIAWVRWETGNDQVTAALREICRKPPFPMNEEQESEVIDFFESLHVVLSTPGP